jgi:geranylgeranyl diphosphate synthase type I
MSIIIFNIYFIIYFIKSCFPGIVDDMQDFFALQKQKITAFLLPFLEKKRKDLKRTGDMGGGVCARLKTFVPRGKMLRGGLLVLSYGLFKTGVPASVIQAGAALELVQAGLLIHDDIMDGDLERRGEKSLFYEYAARAQARKLNRAFHVGESLGICAGDIAFFLSYELLSGLDLPAGSGAGGNTRSDTGSGEGSHTRPGLGGNTRSGAGAGIGAERCTTAGTIPRLIGLVSRELSYVAAAQMLDVYRGAQDRLKLSENDILRLYTYKTARYTFSLPLLCGALLARAAEKQLPRLEKIGELLGIIFQIKDDELGLFGDSDKTGKPVGSDIKEGKKNLYYYYLFGRGLRTDHERLLNLFGSGQAGKKEIEEIRSLVIGLGIQEKINKKVDQLAARVSRMITQLPSGRGGARELLLELLRYNLKRVA